MLLHVPHGMVLSARGEQLFVCAPLDDLPALEDQDLVGVCDRRQVVRDHNGRLPRRARRATPHASAASAASAARRAAALPAAPSAALGAQLAEDLALRDRVDRRRRLNTASGALHNTVHYATALPIK